MKRLFLPLLALAAIIAAIGFYSIGKHSPQREIESSYASLNDAFRRRDLNAYMKLLAPDFTEIRLTGKPRDLREMESVYRNSMNAWADFQKQQADILRFKLEKDRATATTDKVTIGTMIDTGGGYGPKGASHKMGVETVDVDTWIDTPDGWRLQTRNISAVQLSVDGQPFPKPDHDHAHADGHIQADGHDHVD